MITFLVNFKKKISDHFRPSEFAGKKSDSSFHSSRKYIYHPVFGDKYIYHPILCLSMSEMHSYQKNAAGWSSLNIIYAYASHSRISRRGSLLAHIPRLLILLLIEMCTFHAPEKVLYFFGSYNL